VYLLYNSDLLNGYHKTTVIHIDTSGFNDQISFLQVS